MSAFGKVDILINNAGTSRAMTFDKITDDIWQEDLDLKLFGAIRLTRLVWPGMQERKWGRIINVLNLGAKAPKAGGAPTAVSRAAGMALMKILSNEGAPHGILVNGMLVGLIDSDQHVRRHQTTASNVPYDEFRAKMGANVPIGRLHDRGGDQHGRWRLAGRLTSPPPRGPSAASGASPGAAEIV
jgi:NAD(P)-dependent dehydrogenase (short-subunit alcohol dehydrogenase family)